MRILLLSTDLGDKKFFSSVAQAAGLGYVEVSSATELCDELLKDPASFLVVDVSSAELYQAFENAIVDKVGLYSATLNLNNIFYISSKPVFECDFLQKTQVFGHFIDRTYSDEDKNLISRLFKQTISERAFGIENYFSSEARCQTISITKTVQKKVIVESLRTHLVKIGFKGRMATIIANAADEMIMNAIFDAPVDELGKRLHEKTSRAAVFDLEGKSQIEFKIVFDGKLLGLSVSDNHGSLDRKKLISQHLSKSYEKSEYHSKSLIANAGLGMSQVYRNCGGMIFVCDTGNRTEVTLFFKKTITFREFKDQFRFLSTFVYFS